MNSKKRTVTVLLAAMLALSFLLTACGTGGDTPTGDNSTPGTSSAPTGDNSTPNTSGTATTSNTIEQMKQQLSALDTAFASEKATKPAWSDPSLYDMEKKADIDAGIDYHFGSEVDVDRLVSEVIEEFGEYIDARITPEALRTAVLLGRSAAVQNKNYKSLTGLPESSYIKANEYLTGVGEESLGVFETLDPGEFEKAAKNSIVALAISASLYYEQNWGGFHSEFYDLVNAFGCAYDDPRGFILDLHNRYYVIEDTANAENELNQKLEILVPTDTDISKYYKSANEFDYAQCARDLGYTVEEPKYHVDYSPQMAYVYADYTLPDGVEISVTYSRGIGTSDDGTETVSQWINVGGFPDNGGDFDFIMCFEFRLGILQVGSEVRQTGDIAIGFKSAGGSGILLQEKQIQQLVGVLKTVKALSSFDELIEYGELLSGLYDEYPIIY